MKRRGRATETHNPKTMKQDTSKYIALLNELQTHRDPFVLGPILDRFGVPKRASIALVDIGYLSKRGTKRATRYLWTGPASPNPGELRLMALATVKRMSELYAAKKTEQSAVPPTLEPKSENPCVNLILEASKKKGVFNVSKLLKKYKVGKEKRIVLREMGLISPEAGKGTKWVGGEVDFARAQLLAKELVEKSRERNRQRFVVRPLTPPAVEQVKPPVIEEIKAPVVTTKRKATPEKVSILWGLFTWQKG